MERWRFKNLTNTIFPNKYHGLKRLCIGELACFVFLFYVSRKWNNIVTLKYVSRRYRCWVLQLALSILLLRTPKRIKFLLLVQINFPSFTQNFQFKTHRFNSCVPSTSIANTTWSPPNHGSHFFFVSQVILFIFVIGFGRRLLFVGREQSRELISGSLQRVLSPLLLLPLHTAVLFCLNMMTF